MFVVGFATRDEILQLEDIGWHVEDATKFGKVVGTANGTLMLPPEEGPSGTRAIVVFVDAAASHVLDNKLAVGFLPTVGKAERHTDEDPTWPDLPSDEEFLRIVLLQSRVMGKDITVEPYKSWNNELAWRRTDQYTVSAAEKTMSVEQVYELQHIVTRMSQGFSDQKSSMATFVRNRLCSHKKADGTSARVGIPIPGEHVCTACGYRFDSTGLR